MPRIVILGGGPAGYEAALAARALGAEVTIVEKAEPGGSCVLYDCVPSKTFIVSADAATAFRRGEDVGVVSCEADAIHVDLHRVHTRVRELAQAQSNDIASRLREAGVEALRGFASLAEGASVHSHRVAIDVDGKQLHRDAETVLIATGGSPRILPGAQPDGERILTWRQLYDLRELPSDLIIVGSGITGAEFASAYQEMGSRVTLLSSRDRVMPHEDSDAAMLLERLFSQRGMRLLFNVRATAVKARPDGVEVALEGGRKISGSHVLMTVGAVPNTKGFGLEEQGVALNEGGYIATDRVSRTSVPGIYAAGDCTGVMALASVAAMQGRIAMWHALGEAVTPLNLSTVAANVFTNPEVATVGIGQKSVDAGVRARCVTLSLDTNARAKMADIDDGFVKLYSRPESGVIIGGVVVAPRASELIMPIAMAVQNSLTATQFAATTAIYPSLAGSLTEAARQLVV